MEKVHPQNDFTNAKVGDEVYCLVAGEGIIVKILSPWKEYPIIVSFPQSDKTYEYSKNGSSGPLQKNPTLYHLKPQIIPAKRLVEKKIEGFIALTKSGSFYFSKEMTTKYLHLCEPDKINISATITYTISE